jgi:hypothetical protein
MNLVKNSRLKVMVKKMADMDRIKSDVFIMSYSFNGTVCGVHVADVC